MARKTIGILAGTAQSLLLLACTQPAPIANVPPTVTQGLEASTPTAVPVTAADTAASQHAPSATPEADDSVTVGLVLPSTGRQASLGLAMLRGAQLKAEEVNAKGGLVVGGDHREVKLRVENDDNTGAGAAAAGTRLIEQGVKLIVGPLGPNTIALYPLAEKANAILLASGLVDFLGKSNPHSFRIAPTAIRDIGATYKVVSERYPYVKTMVSIQPNDASGQAAVDALRMVTSRLNLNLVAWEYYERGTTDFRPALTKLLAMEPHLIDLTSSPPGEAVAIALQSRELGYHGKLVATMDEPGTIVSGAGVAAEGTIGLAAMDFTQPDLSKEETDFAERYRARYKEEPRGSAPIAYDALAGLFSAITGAGTLDTTTVADALGNSKWNGVGGSLYFSDRDSYGGKGIRRQLAADSVIAELVGGHVTLIGRVPFGEAVPGAAGPPQ